MKEWILQPILSKLFKCITIYTLCSWRPKMLNMHGAFLDTQTETDSLKSEN